MWKNKKILRRILLPLCCVVVFATTYALILPAITMEKDEASVVSEDSALETASSTVTIDGQTYYKVTNASITVSQDGVETDEINPYSPFYVAMSFTGISYYDVSETSDGEYYYLAYQLPGNVTYTGETSGSMTVTDTDGSTRDATWEIVTDEDGNSYIVFKIVVDANDATDPFASLTANWNGNFEVSSSGSGDESDNSISWTGSSTTTTIDTEAVDGRASVEKTAAEYNKGDNSVTYTVTITAEGDLYNVKLTDVLSQYLDASTLTVSGVTDGYTVSYTTDDDGNVIFTVTSADSTYILAGSTVTFSYTVDLSASALEADAKSVVDNSITLSYSPSESSETTGSVSDDSSVDINQQNAVTKSGTATNNDGTVTVTYSVTINNGDYTYDLSGYTYTDTLYLSSLGIAYSDTLAESVQSQIESTLTGSGLTSEDFTVSVSESADGNLVVTITFSEELDESKSKSYTFSYTMTFSVDELTGVGNDSRVQLTNTVTDDNGNTGTTSPGIYVTHISKSYNDSSFVYGQEETTLTFTVTLYGNVNEGDTLYDGMTYSDTDADGNTDTDTDTAYGSIDISTLVMTVNNTAYYVSGTENDDGSYNLESSSGESAGTVTFTYDADGNVTGYTVTFTTDLEGPVTVTYSATVDSSDITGTRTYKNTATWGLYSATVTKTVKTDATTWTPTVYKTLQNSPSMEYGEFTFSLTELIYDDETGGYVSDEYTDTAYVYSVTGDAWSGSNASSSARFGTITYTEEGVHYYVIEENIPDDADESVTYDTTKYYVRVEVLTDESTNTLYTVVTYYTDDTFTEQTTVSSMSFTNTKADISSELEKTAVYDEDTGTITYYLSVFTSAFMTGANANQTGIYDITFYDTLPEGLTVTELEAWFGWSSRTDPQYGGYSVLSADGESSGDFYENGASNGYGGYYSTATIGQYVSNVETSDGGTDVTVEIRSDTDIYMTNVNNQAAYYVIKIVCDIDLTLMSDYYDEATDTYIIDNTFYANATTGDGSAGTDVTVPNTWVSKSGTYTEEDVSKSGSEYAVMHYTIDINPGGLTILDDDSDENYITLEDTFSYDAILLINSIKVTNSSTGEELTYTAYLEDLENDEEGQYWSYLVVFDSESGTKTLYLYVPDSTPLTIEYDLDWSEVAETEWNSTLGKYTYVWTAEQNTVTLTAVGATSSTESVTATQVEATASGSLTRYLLYIYKYGVDDEGNANTDVYLNGAVFSFWKYALTYSDYSTNLENKYRSWDGAGWYHTIDRTTGEFANGLIRFGYSADLVANRLYAWYESAAPDGYEADDTIHYLVFFNTSDTSWFNNTDFYGYFLDETSGSRRYIYINSDGTYYIYDKDGATETVTIDEDGNVYNETGEYILGTFTAAYMSEYEGSFTDSSGTTYYIYMDGAGAMYYYSDTYHKVTVSDGKVYDADGNELGDYVENTSAALESISGASTEYLWFLYLINISRRGVTEYDTGDLASFEWLYENVTMYDTEGGSTTVFYYGDSEGTTGIYNEPETDKITWRPTATKYLNNGDLEFGDYTFTLYDYSDDSTYTTLAGMYSGMNDDTGHVYFYNEDGEILTFVHETTDWDTSETYTYYCVIEEDIPEGAVLQSDGTWYYDGVYYSGYIYYVTVTYNYYEYSSTWGATATYTVYYKDADGNLVDATTSTVHSATFTNSVYTGLSVTKVWENTYGSETAAVENELTFALYRKADDTGGDNGGSADYDLYTTESIQVLALGDSITAGVTGVSESTNTDYSDNGSYRKYFYWDMTDIGYNVDMVGSSYNSIWGGYSRLTDPGVNQTAIYGNREYDDNFYANSGWKIEDLNSYYSTTSQYAYLTDSATQHYIFLMIGTNDAGAAGGSWTTVSVDDMLSKFETLMKTISSNVPEDTQFFIMTLPSVNYNYYSYDTSQNADYYKTSFENTNDAIRQLVEESDSYHLIDVATAMPTCEDDDFSTYIGGDGIHPTEEGYELIADTVTSAFLSYLQTTYGTDDTGDDDSGTGDDSGDTGDIAYYAVDNLPEDFYYYYTDDVDADGNPNTLYINTDVYELVEEFTLSDENSWTYLFENLDSSYVYYVVETTSGSWTVTYETDQSEGVSPGTSDMTNVSVVNVVDTSKGSELPSAGYNIDVRYEVDALLFTLCFTICMLGLFIRRPRPL